jgi:hypothetical protein
MSMNREQFEREKQAWLKSHFANVACETADDGGVIARVPLLYKVDLYQPRESSPFAHFHTGRHRFILTPVEVRGLDANDGLSALFDEIVMNPDNWAIHGGAFDLYLPKAGQNPAEVIKTGEPMTVVRHDDPEHEHGSPRLIDFAIIQLQPMSRQPTSREILFEKGTLDGMHSHFLIK